MEPMMPGGCFLAAHALCDLRGEDGGDVEAAGAFDDVDEGAGCFGDGGELVDDEQDASLARFAGDGPLGELLDEEAGEVAGFVLEAEAVEEEVAAVELVEVELVRRGRLRRRRRRLRSGSGLRRPAGPGASRARSGGARRAVRRAARGRRRRALCCRGGGGTRRSFAAVRVGRGRRGGRA